MRSSTWLAPPSARSPHSLAGGSVAAAVGAGSVARWQLGRPLGAGSPPGEMGTAALGKSTRDEGQSRVVKIVVAVAAMRGLAV